MEKRREENRAVAELLAEWVRPKYASHYSNDDRWTNADHVLEENILTLDKRSLTLLLPLLANAQGNVGTNELIVQTRKVLF